MIQTAAAPDFGVAKEVQLYDLVRPVMPRATTNTRHLQWPTRGVADPCQIAARRLLLVQARAGEGRPRLPGPGSLKGATCAR